MAGKLIFLSTAVVLGAVALVLAGMGTAPRAVGLLFLALAAMAATAGLIAWVFLRRRGQ